MTDQPVTLAQLRIELAPLRAIADGIPFIHRKLETIQQDMRMLRTSMNDLATLHPTGGEILALHHDVNAVMAKNAELEIKIATLERIIREQQQ